MKLKRWTSHPLEKMGFIYPWLMAQMTLLPSSIQWNHYHAIMQFKGQKCPSTSKKGQYLKTWHESEWKTRSHSLSYACSLLCFHTMAKKLGSDECGLRRAIIVDGEARNKSPKYRKGTSLPAQVVPLTMVCFSDMTPWTEHHGRKTRGNLQRGRGWVTRQGRTPRKGGEEEGAGERRDEGRETPLTPLETRGSPPLCLSILAS